MTDQQSTAVYKHYSDALDKWRSLPPAAQKTTPVPEWADSVKALGFDPKPPVPKVSPAQAQADLARAKAEVAEANS